MYQKYGIQLKPVEESDADFIIELRTNNQKSRFISATNPDVTQQKEWIKDYKIREKKGEEYQKLKKNKQINIVKLDIMIKEYVFNVLQLENLHFEVRKLNMSVIKYHKKFYPKITSEDELNYYFSLNKSEFERGKQNFIKMLN